MEDKLEPLSRNDPEQTLSTTDWTMTRIAACQARDIRGDIDRSLLSQVSRMLVICVLEREGDRLFNSAVVIERGELVGAARRT